MKGSGRTKRRRPLIADIVWVVLTVIGLQASTVAGWYWGGAANRYYGYPSEAWSPIGVGVWVGSMALGTLIGWLVGRAAARAIAGSRATSLDEVPPRSDLR